MHPRLTEGSLDSSNTELSPKHIYVKKLQFIHSVNGDGSKTAKITKRHY